MQRLILFFIILLVVGCGGKSPVNIYDSEEYKNLTKKEIIVGESVWVTTCFRCHMYGNMGAASVRDKVHFEQLATKGLINYMKVSSMAWMVKKVSCQQKVPVFPAQKMI